MNSLASIVILTGLSGFLSALAASFFLALGERRRAALLPHLVSFATGALLGAAAGMLFATQSGEETREQIQKKSLELSEQATHKAEEARAKAEHLLADARQKFDEATKELQTRAKELQEQAKTLIDEKQAQLKELTHKEEAEVAEAVAEAIVVEEPAAA